MKYRIEAITLPVSDVDRAKAFYEQAGWHLDVDTEPAYATFADLDGNTWLLQEVPCRASDE